MFIPIFWGAQTAVLAQEETLSLRLNRDFGYGAGLQIRGTFSFRIEGPDNLARVDFYIDDQLVGSADEAPFRLQFRTTSYETGIHSLKAVGFTKDGRELISNTLQRDFVSAGVSRNNALLIIIPILVISLVGRLIVARVTNRERRTAGKPVIEGPLGGTVCPKCGKPFAIHLWSLRLVTVRADRCPHCGKWSIIHRAHPDDLNAALDDMETDTATPPSSGDNLDKKLDDSRFM